MRSVNNRRARNAVSKRKRNGNAQNAVGERRRNRKASRLIVKHESALSRNGSGRNMSV